MTDIQVGYPRENNWPWIIERHAETAWASLTPELQVAVSIESGHILQTSLGASQLSCSGHY